MFSYRRVAVLGLWLDVKVSLSFLKIPSSPQLSWAYWRTRICPDRTSLSLSLSDPLGTQCCAAHWVRTPWPLQFMAAPCWSVTFLGRRRHLRGLVEAGTLALFLWAGWSQGSDAGMGWSGKERMKGWRQGDRRTEEHGAGLGKATQGSAGQCMGLLLGSIWPVLLFSLVGV